MLRNPESGHELLSGSQNRFIQLSATIALRHQERYDGSGYPDGLAGDELPIEARIVAVSYVFYALLSVLPYKRAWSFDEALDLISALRCQRFAPRVVDSLPIGRASFM